MHVTLLFLSITTIGILMLESIDLNESNLVYSDEDNSHLENAISREILDNQLKEPASAERVILYMPFLLTNGEEVRNLVENDTVIFSGFVQSKGNLSSNIVSLYAVSNGINKDNPLGTSVIEDPISTQFSFKVNITSELVKVSRDHGNQLQFMVYHGDIPSNKITVNILADRDESSKFRQIFDPQKYNIPDKVILNSRLGGSISNSFAYLAYYEVVENNTGNVRKYSNTNDDVDRFDTRRDYNWNLTSGKSIITVKFENGNAKALFLDMFLRHFESIEIDDDGRENKSIVSPLYRFDSLEHGTLRFKAPLVQEGLYYTEIKAFFENNIKATYLLSKTAVWFN